MLIVESRSSRQSRLSDVKSAAWLQARMDMLISPLSYGTYLAPAGRLRWFGTNAAISAVRLNAPSDLGQNSRPTSGSGQC